MHRIKVITRIGSGLYSYVATGEAQVRYYKRKEATAPPFLAEKNFGLSVFETKEHANHFLSLDHFPEESELWLAWCEEELSPPPWVWTDRLARGRTEPIEFPISWPDGSLFYRKVTILEKIR